MENTEQEIQTYLKESTILIVDQQSSARVGLKKTLITMGAQTHKIYSVGNFEEAESIIEDQLPRVILCDYQCNGRYGIELLQKLRAGKYQHADKSIFIIVTANTSQSAVAQAAEEDIDAYVLKPYTLDGLRHSIGKAILTKLRPSEYSRMIEFGKKQLADNQLDEALQTFQTALSKQDRPSLACYYEGFTFFRKAKLTGSKSSYQKGLTYNKLHYKCLVGLVDLLTSLNENEEAYRVIQQIIRFFPANPKRLSQVLKLAIQTEHYEDVEQFYEDFLKIEERSDQIIVYICAALLICAKHFFRDQKSALALDFINKAVVSSGGRHHLLRKAIEILTENHQLEMAQQVLRRFSSPIMSDRDFATASFLVCSLEQDPGKVITMGLNLLNQGINEPDIYRITIANLKRCDKPERAEEVRGEARKHYPELADEY
jgi:CheY-like chemotaxis protein